LISACESTNPLVRDIDSQFSIYPDRANGPAPQSIVDSLVVNNNIDGFDSRTCATPLQAAIVRGSIGTVKLLVERGANLQNTQACNGRSSLVGFALSNGQFQIAEFLYNKGAKFERFYSYDGLQLDACSGNSHLCKEFLKKVGKSSPKMKQLFARSNNTFTSDDQLTTNNLQSYNLSIQGHIENTNTYVQVSKFSSDGEYIVEQNSSGLSVVNRQGLHVFSAPVPNIIDVAISPSKQKVASLSDGFVTIMNIADATTISIESMLYSEGQIEFLSETSLLIATKYAVHYLDLTNKNYQTTRVLNGNSYIEVSVDKQRIFVCQFPSNEFVVLDRHFNEIFKGPNSANFCGMQNGRTATMSLDGRYVFNQFGGVTNAYKLDAKVNTKPFKVIRVDGKYSFLTSSIDGETLAFAKNFGFGTEVINFGKTYLSSTQKATIKLSESPSFSKSKITLDPLYELAFHRSVPAFSPNGSEFLVRNNFEYKLYNANGEYIDMHSTIESLPSITAVKFSPDSKYLAVAYSDKTVTLWGSEGRIITRFYNVKGRFLRSLTFLPKNNQKLQKDKCESNFLTESQSKVGTIGNYLICGSSFTHGDWTYEGEIDFTDDANFKKQLKYIDIIAGKDPHRKTQYNDKYSTLQYKKRPELHVVAYDLSQKTHLEAIALGDNTVQIRNLKNGASFTLASVGEEWIIYNDKMYFDSSKDIGSKIKFTNNLKAYSVDYFAPRYNRPDLILKNVWNTTTPVLQEMKRLAMARQEQAEADKNATRPIVSNVKLEKNGRQLKYQFTASDKHSRIAAYNVFVNGNPIYGVDGLALRQSENEQIRGELTLNANSNIVEIEATNALNVKSLRESHEISGTNEATVDVYFVGVGVSNYKDNQLNLNYPAKDIADLDSVLAGLKNTRKIGNVYSKVLVNDDATVANISDLQSFLRQPREDDIVIMLVAGHGVRENNKYYYLSHEANVNSLETSTAQFSIFENLLVNTKSRSKILFIDTCQSGDAMSTVSDSYFEFAKENNLQARTTQYTINRGLKRAARSSKDSNIRLNDRYISNNLDRKTGAIIFSSSQGDEFSYESHAIRNGFFTSEIITALTSSKADLNFDGMISKNELRLHVSSVVAQKTSGKQHPVLDRDNLLVDFKLPILE
jgi:WD40 repeat protein/uncharacterized caspase-like protein